MTEPKKVLIAEDEDAVRTALDQALTEAGITTLTASDGQTALDLALAKHPDLIVLDVIMPKLHGMDVYRNIRNDEWGSRVKIIFLTSFGKDPKVEEASKHEQTELVIKSDSKLDGFVALIKKYLGLL